MNESNATGGFVPDRSFSIPIKQTVYPVVNEEPTIRDRYAMAAMAGILAAHTGGRKLPDFDELAENVIAYADAAMKARL